MITGMMKTIKSLASAALLLFVITGNVYSKDSMLDSILNKLSSIKQRSESFTEVKLLNVLQSQVELEGTLEFYAPERLIKVTQNPVYEVLDVSKNSISIQKGDNEAEELLITDYPLLAAFVEAYRGMLSGNKNKLFQYYQVETKGDLNNWTISLFPIDDEVVEYLEKIIFEGQQAFIKKIITVEASSDKSIMYIKH